MEPAVAFYGKLGFELSYGGQDAGFTSLRAGTGYVNLILRKDYAPQWWGRAIFYVDDVDAHHRAAVAAGLNPPNPEDAPWGERYYHISDPDGHELSFAQPLDKRQ
jgi:catechol 2,3-dioxygenase-like lactoylglutathione lyase family enzyme